MIDQKSLLGILNTDDPNENLPQGHHKDARNIRVRGPEGDVQIQGIPGTRAVANSFLPSTGTNELIFAKYDQVNQRVFEFVYSSIGEHGIYIFDVVTETYDVLIKIGAATDGDILGFDLQTALCSVDIIYGDSQDGDILTFIDTLQRPTAIGINKFLNNPYTVTKRLYIDVAKAPPLMPPQVTYENDDDVVINNCRNSLFQFAYAFYDVNEFLTLLSVGSEVPLPYLPFAVTSDTDSSKNSRIAVYLSTGDVNYRRILLAVRQTKDGATSDWLKVVELDKDELAIADNTIYKFEFLNDALYIPLSTKYTIPIQDYVPIKAGTQTALRGNVLAYANITEGLDLVEPDVDGSVSNQLYPYTTLNGLLFFAAQTGLNTGGTGNEIVLHLTGVGTNNGSGDPTTLDNSEAIYKVDARNAAGASVAFQYDNTTQVETVTNIFDGLSAAAVIAGWTEISRTTNTMTLQYSTDVVLLGNGIIRSTGTTLSDDDAIYVYPPEGRRSFGMIYRDEHGRISSTITDIPFNIITPVSSGTQMPLIQLEINHRPPLYAVSWALVRSPDLTYNKRLCWITFAAYEGIISVNNERYAYVDVQNIYTYNQDIKSTSATVKYDFTPGDRIRFISRVKFDNSIVALTGKDYEILGLVTSITDVNSKKITGSFIQIKYPTADISVDFKFDGTFEFMNYEVLIYNYGQHISASDTGYFEFDKSFGIGNSGTSQAYHIGLEQSQTANLSQPAIVTTYEGDYFLRKRLVPTGMTYQNNLLAGKYGWDDLTTLPIEVPTTIVTTYYTITTINFANANFGTGDYPTYSDTNYFNNTSAGTLRVRIRFKMTFNTDAPLQKFQIHAKINNSAISVTDTIIYPYNGILQEGVEQNAEVDTILNIPSGAKFTIIVEKGGAHLFVSASILTIDILNQHSINVVEDSFSDVYAIKTNSNSKPNVIEPNAKQITYQNLYRWSLSYNQGTNINELNRFLASNQDVTDLSSGAIQRMTADGNRLNFYLERSIGATGIYAKFIQDANATGTLATTDEIITKNNIQYYLGEWGLGKHPESLVSSDNANYVVDPIRGRHLRIAADGVTDLTKTYKGQFVISPILTKYNKEWDTPTGGKAMIKGTYDFYEEQYMCLLQGGENGDDTISDYMIGFDEKRNGYRCFFDFHPEFILSVQEKLYSWLSGNLYIHDDTNNYCKFYGTQYSASVTLLFNKYKNIKQVFNAIAYQSNQIFVSAVNGDIKTSMINPQTGFQQISQLKSVDYELQENIRYASLLRDANSGLDAQLALVEGDYLTGNWVEIKFSYNGSSFSFFYLPYILSQPSPRNY